jgi:hypothetical protein
VPEALRELPAFGPYALLWAGFWIAVAAQPHRAIGDRALLALIAAVVPVGLLLHVRNVAGDGMTRGELARAAFWPPEWWGMWWPRTLRRPSDLWPRLPWPARASRLALSVFLVALPAMILGRQWAEALAAASAPPGWFDVIERVLIVGCTLALVAPFAWARRRGLSAAEAVRFLLGATAPGAGWSAPAIARLVRPASGVTQPHRDSPSEHQRAIERLVAANPTLPDATALVAEVRRAVAEIERCDAELAALRHDASSAELDRLATRVSLLEGDASASEPRRELAELLRGQLALLRRMRVRAEDVTERRGLLMQWLRAAWRASAEGRAAAPLNER